eukprot:5997836-Prymnesium_polylepis.1
MAQMLPLCSRSLPHTAYNPWCPLSPDTCRDYRSRTLPGPPPVPRFLCGTAGRLPHAQLPHDCSPCQQGKKCK